MNCLSKYEIPFKGLKEGTHEFLFELDDRFFARFENSEVKKGKLEAKVTLNRQSTFLILEMAVNGNVELVCDRCLNNYWQKIKNRSKLFVKFGVEAEEISDEVIAIPFEQSQINVAQYLYELVILGLPLKHVHPADKDGNSTCDPEMIKRLNEYLVDGDASDGKGKDHPVDERWNELKKLLDN